MPLISISPSGCTCRSRHATASWRARPGATAWSSFPPSPAPVDNRGTSLVDRGDNHDSAGRRERLAARAWGQLGAQRTAKFSLKSLIYRVKLLLGVAPPGTRGGRRLDEADLAGSSWNPQPSPRRVCFVP